MLMRQREGRRLVDPHQRRMDDEAPVHAEIERDLHRLDGVVAAIRIAGVVGLAHAGDEMLGAAPIGERAGEAEEDRLRPGHEGGRQAALRDLDRDVAGERGVGDRRERVEPTTWSSPSRAAQSASSAAMRLAHARPHVELDPVPLAVVEADGLDAREALERPGQAHGGILPAGEQDEGGVGGRQNPHASAIPE